MGKPLTKAAFGGFGGKFFSFFSGGDAEQWFYFAPWHSPDLQYSMPRASHICSTEEEQTIYMLLFC